MNTQKTTKQRISSQTKCLVTVQSGGEENEKENEKKKKTEFTTIFFFPLLAWKERGLQQ